MKKPLIRRNERGVIAVEAAIAASLLVMLFFGIMEVGVLLRTRTIMTDASREGVRVAAALPRVDNYQNNAVAAVNGVIAGTNGDPIDYMTVYRADPLTGLPLSGEGVETCFTDCWRYEWVAGGFEQKLGASWPGADQLACGGLTDTDWVAVYVRGHYRSITPFFSIDRSFTDTTIMRLEPLDLTVPCRP